MYQEMRITIRDEDSTVIDSYSDYFGADKDEKVVRISLTKVLTNGMTYMSSDTHLTIGVETAKLMVQKLQEGINAHENEA